MEGGKWGLVIIFAAFMIQVLAFGTTSAIGVYNIELLDYFGGATVAVSLIGSINYGVFLGSGPIVSFLMTKFTYRKIALFGSTLIIIGLLGMPVLPYIPAMCVCFGLLAGFGSCCAYIPSHVLSGLYYDKQRSLATGVATSGSGLGGAVMPVLAGLLIEHYSWKGSLIFVAGLCLHLLVFSALLRAPPPSTSSVTITMDDSFSSPKEEEIVKTRDEESSLIPKTCVKNSGESNHDHVGQNVGRHDGVNENHSLMTKQENVRPLSVNSAEYVVVENGGSAESGKLISNKATNRQISFLTNEHSLSLTSLHSVSCSRGASQLVLDGAAGDKSSTSKNTMMQADVESGPKVVPKSSRHVYIFTNYGFDVYFASNIMWNAGSAIVNAFAPEFLTERGLSAMEAAWYNGAFGFGCFIGGVLGGVFGNFKCVNRQALYTVSNIVMGVCLIGLPIFETWSMYLTCLLISGIAFGIILGLLIVVLTDLVGVESLGNGLGYLMLSNGLGTFVGPPLAGLMKEMTGTFDESMILSGALCVVGGLIMFLMPCGRSRCGVKAAGD